MTNDLDLKTITTPILVNLLRNGLRFPRLFILACRLTLGRFKKRINQRFPDALVELAARPLWVYLNLKKNIGQRKALEVRRVAPLTAGVAKQNFLFDTVAKGQSFQTFAEQELEINKTGTTKWNALEVAERTNRRFQIRITFCLYHELAVSVGAPEITPIVCQIDNAVFNSYLPDQMVFHRGGVNRRIADGGSQCDFILETVDQRSWTSACS
jgi:L-2-amino-thiazoline-4-carboxylic acid hydrolase